MLSLLQNTHIKNKLWEQTVESRLLVGMSLLCRFCEGSFKCVPEGLSGRVRIWAACLFVTVLFKDAPSLRKSFS